MVLLNLISEGNAISSGGIMQVLRDNQQRHHWLRQESFLAHQSASIERLEMAIDSQKRTIQFQANRNRNFNRNNRHRGGQNFPRYHDMRKWRPNHCKPKRGPKGAKNGTNNTTEGNTLITKNISVTGDQVD